MTPTCTAMTPRTTKATPPRRKRRGEERAAPRQRLQGGDGARGRRRCPHHAGLSPWPCRRPSAMGHAEKSHLWTHRRREASRRCRRGERELTTSPPFLLDPPRLGLDGGNPAVASGRRQGVHASRSPHSTTQSRAAGSHVHRSQGHHCRLGTHLALVAAPSMSQRPRHPAPQSCEEGRGEPARVTATALLPAAVRRPSRRRLEEHRPPCFLAEDLGSGPMEGTRANHTVR
jgi:hypothetical protein